MAFTPRARWIPVAGVLLLCTSAAAGQGTRTTAQSESPSGLTMSAEAFCSATRIRTSNVRLRWSLSPDARAARQVPTLSVAKQRLDTTVYRNGFEKGLFVTLQVPSSSPAAAVSATVPATTGAAQLRDALPRSLQIRLIEAQDVSPTAASADGGFVAVVEDLEPGLNYTWRLTVDTPAGAVVSAPVTVQAVACPVDEVEAPKPPPAGKPPAKKPPPPMRRQR